MSQIYSGKLMPQMLIIASQKQYSNIETLNTNNVVFENNNKLIIIIIIMCSLM